MSGIGGGVEAEVGSDWVDVEEVSLDGGRGAGFGVGVVEIAVKSNIGVLFVSSSESELSISFAVVKSRETVSVPCGEGLSIDSVSVGVVVAAVVAGGDAGIAGGDELVAGGNELVASGDSEEVRSRFLLKNSSMESKKVLP